MRKLLAIVLLCFAVTNFSFEQSIKARTPSELQLNSPQSTPALSDIDTIINDALESFHVPGVAIGVIVDGKVVLSKGYGFRDLDHALPVNDKTLFAVASNTKAFTAFVLGQLVDEGKIAWDDPVTHYIPEFRLLDPNSTQYTTVRDLVAHRTGLARHDYLWLMKDELSRDDIIDRVGHLELVSPLRAEFQYNNLTYTIAGIVIERVTGQSWEDAISSRIFKPLQMDSSDTSITQMQQNENFSLPYAEIDGQVKELPFLSAYSIAPAAAINSNVSDMLKWIQLQISDGSLLGNNFIQKKTLEDLHTTQIPLRGAKEKDEINVLGYGMGWFTGTYRGHKYINHDGSFDGFISQVSILPKQKIGVVVLTNSSSDGKFLASAISKTIIDKLLGANDTAWEALAMEERSEMQKENLENSQQLGGYTSPAHNLEEYAGDYEHPAYGMISVRIENNSLVASYGNVDMPLNHQQTDIFDWDNSSSIVFGEKTKLDFLFSKDVLRVPFEPAVPPIVFKKLQKRSRAVVSS